MRDPSRKAPSLPARPVSPDPGSAADPTPPEVVPFDPAYREDFPRLNLEWIERHFRVEARDREHLGEPEKAILAPGGEIFFVRLEGRVVGTCAMQPVRAGDYELAKMAVDPACRGRGLAHLLMRAAIDWARARGAERIVLHSNTRLVPAIELYRQYGFTEVPLGPDVDWERADIEMELRLGGAPERGAPPTP